MMMMSAKMTTLGSHLWRHNLCQLIINKILSRDSNYIVDVVMWPKFCNSSTSMKEVIMTSIF